MFLNDEEDATTDNDQGLHLVNIFPVRMSILTKGGAGVHLGGLEENYYSTVRNKLPEISL